MAISSFPNVYLLLAFHAPIIIIQIKMTRPYLPYLRQCVIWLPIGVTFHDIGFGIAKVDGKSMHPHIFSSDFILIEKFTSFFFQGFPRGHVYSFPWPPHAPKIVLKRLVAKEKDWISTKNGEYLQVPDGSAWMEGDCEAVSEDSQVYGPVPLGILQGRALAIVWPPTRWRILEPSIPQGKEESMGL